MNKAKLAENLYGRLRLRPIARRMTVDGEWQPPIDYDWILTEVWPDAARICNIHTGHTPLLGLDHIHHYVSDPARDGNGLKCLKHGFLDLNVQLTLSGCNVFTEPLRSHRPRRRAARISN